MAQRQNFGFNIGGGGIADLVKSPTITPARGFSFSPTPTIRREKDSKDALRGALLGAIAPSAAGLALSGLGKIPGLEKLLYKEDPFIKQAQTPLDTTETLPTKADSPQGIIDALRRQRLAGIDKALPPLPAPKTKTALGNILQQAIQYAPGLAFDDDDSDAADAYIKSVQGASKTLADLDKLKADAALKRSQARGTAAAKVDPKLTPVIVNGFKENKKTGELIAYQTEALRDEEGNTWIKSNDDPDFDLQQGTNEVVPKGQYYRNSRMTLLDGDLGEVTTKTFQDSGGITDGQLYEVSLRKVRDPETNRPKIQRVVLTDDGSFKTVAQMKQEGYNLVSTVDLTTDRAVPNRLAKPQQDALRDLETRREATRSLGRLGVQIMDRLGMANAVYDEKSGMVKGLDESITTGSTQYAANLADVLDRNIRAFGSKLRQLYNLPENTDDTTVFDTFIDQNVDPDSAAKTLADSITGYQAALESGEENQIASRRSRVVNQLLKIKDESGLSPKDDNSWLNYDRDELTKYLQDTKFYGAAQIRLAFLLATARGESLSRISDRDVALNLQTLGFEDGSPSVVMDNLSGALFDAIRDVDGRAGYSATLRKIDELPNLNQSQREMILEDIRDDIAARYNLDLGPESDQDRLYNSQDPAEVGRLRRKIRGDIQRNMGGITSSLIYDSNLQMFIPSTLSREILFGDDEELRRLGRYLNLMRYNLATGTTPGKRSKQAEAPKSRPVKSTQAKGAFSQTLDRIKSKQDESEQDNL